MTGVVVAVAVGLFVLVVALAVPARHLRSVVLVALPPVLLLGQLPDLDTYAVLHVAAPGIFVLLGATLLRFRTQARRLPGVLFGWAGLGILAVLTVLSTSDWLTVAAQRVLWVGIVLLILLVLAKTRDLGSLRTDILLPLARGFAVCSIVVAASLVLDPDAAANGYGRLVPWGANPNTVSVTAMAAAGLTGYFAVQRRSLAWAPLAAVSCLLVVMLSSRAGVISLVILAVPFVVHAARRPGLAIVALGVFTASAALVIQFGSAVTGVDRLTERNSLLQRQSVAVEYVDRIEERPWVGLLLSEGERAAWAPEIGRMTHNSYLEFAYWGGLLLLAPLLALVVHAAVSGVHVWRRYRHSGEFLVVGLMVALLVVGIGASLGGPTGYAINPARDLGPRIAHAILPIKGKGSSDWSYSWVPVVGPFIGAAIAALLAPALLSLA